MKGSSLINEFWVFTYDDPDEEDKGVAIINMDNTLTMNGIEDDSTVYWGTLVLKVAGTKTTYDCALCQHHFIRALDSNLNPTPEELTEMEERWKLSDQYFTDQVPTRKEVSVLEQFKVQVDPEQNWEWREEMTYMTEIIPNTQIVKFRCPIQRLMNTQDYDDMKFEISLEYKVQGFYVIAGKPNEAGERNMVYGMGDVFTILILDQAISALVPLLFAVVGGLMFV